MVKNGEQIFKSDGKADILHDIRIPQVAIRSGLNAPHAVHEGQRRNAVVGSLTLGNDLCDEASGGVATEYPRIFIGESAGKICGEWIKKMEIQRYSKKKISYYSRKYMII